MWKMPRPSIRKPKSALSSFSSLSKKAAEDAGLNLIPHSSLKFESAAKIGQGGFANVTVAFLDGQKVAVKSLGGFHNLDHLSGEERCKLSQQFAKEMKILKDLEHPNIIKSIGTCISPLSSVLEHMEFNLAHFVDFEDGESITTHSLSELLHQLHILELHSYFESEYKFSVNAIQQVACGLSYLHKNNIAHRDIKTQNILTKSVEGDKRMVFKLCDFGEARSDVLQTQCILHSKTNLVDRGTVVYNPPEIIREHLRQAGISDLLKADIWALGMVIYCCLNPDAKYPWYFDVKENIATFKHIIKDRMDQGLLPTSSMHYSTPQQNALMTIMAKCCDYSPDTRIVAGEILDLFHDIITEDITSDVESLYTDHPSPIIEAIASDVQTTLNINEHSTINEDVTSDVESPVHRNEHIPVIQGITSDVQTPLHINEHSTINEDITSDVESPVHRNEHIPIIEGITSDVQTPLHINEHRPGIFELFEDGISNDSESVEMPEAHRLQLKEDINKESVLSHVNGEDDVLNESSCAMNGTHKIHLSPYSPVCGTQDTTQEYEIEMSDEELPFSQQSASLEMSIHSESIAECSEKRGRSGSPDVTILHMRPRRKKRCIIIESDSDEDTTGNPPVEIPDANASTSMQECMSNVEESSWGVIGDIHQASPVFCHGAAGSQCSSCSIIGVIVSKIKAPREWTKENINSIVKQGNDIHMDILRNRGWPNNRVESKLDLDEMPSVMRCVVENEKITVSIGLLHEAIYDLKKNLATVITSVLKNKKSYSFIIRIGDKCMAIMCHENKYSIFDSHSCDSKGQTDEDGAACVVHFCSDKDMIKYVEMKAMCCQNNDQVDITPVDIEVLSKQKDEHFQQELPVDNESSKSSTQIMSHKSFPEQTQDSNMPVYQQRESGLSVKEILSFCVFTNHNEQDTCKKVPQPISNSVYIVDLDSVNARDVTCDDLGSYDSHSAPRVVVKVHTKDGKVTNTKIISRKKMECDDPILQEEKVYEVKRQYSQRDNGRFGKGTRIISKVFANGNLSRYAVVQYIGDLCCPRPHKNTKINREPYIRTRPSTLDKERELVEKLPPKQVISAIDMEFGGPCHISSPSEIPRNRQQVYNVKKRVTIKHMSRNTGKTITPDFSRLIASMDSGSFLKNVDFVKRDKSNKMFPNTFAATTDALHWIKSFCTPTSQYKSQLGIDMTYKVGPYYTTCLTFAHPMFVLKNDPLQHPTFLAGIMTSTTRERVDYRYMANQLKATGVDTLIYGTDGEVAMEFGLEDVYPIEGIEPKKRSIHLRCFNHVKDNLVATLKEIGIGQRSNLVTAILGGEFGDTRTSGLVDCDSRQFQDEYERVSNTWPEKFKTYVESPRMKVRSLKDTLLKCMGNDVRVAAGLGNPPNKFDNQRAESQNNVLKESVGGRFIDQSSVHDIVYEKVILPQERELMKAIFCQGEYRLAPEFSSFQVSPLTWKKMTVEQRDLKVKKIFKYTPQIEANPDVILRKLSVQPEDCQESLIDLPPWLVQNLWDKAEMMLSYCPIVQLKGGNFSINEDDEAHIVREGSGVFSCDCTQFMKLTLCSHILVIADEKMVLINVLTKFHFSPSIALQNHKPSSAGEKRVKKPRKGRQNVLKRPIVNVLNGNDNVVDIRMKRAFQCTEIWHNDEPFALIYVNSCKNKTGARCAQCGNVISQHAVPPFDVMFSHKERYMYPEKEGDRIVRWVATRNKMRCKYYCIKRSCLLQRHPYFWTGLVNADSVRLSDLHKTLLKEVIDFEVQ